MIAVTGCEFRHNSVRIETSANLPNTKSDLRSGKVLIIPNADKWKIGHYYWILDIQNRSCTNKSSRLVDTYSPLFTRVARILVALKNGCTSLCSNRTQDI